MPKLSLCISTFNRAAYIGATLESILSQVTTDDVEIVVVDGASSDNTEQVVSEHARRYGRLRYIRQSENGGLDRDFDRSVELARGDYCWLMSSDDLLKPGAVTAVLAALSRNYSLVIVNADVMNFTMSEVLLPKLLGVSDDRVYGPDDMDSLFTDAGFYMTYIGCLVIKRDIWLARNRAAYHGSMFTHVGVVFQQRLPGNTLVISNPLVQTRTGNTSTFSSEILEILLFRWSSVVWSLAPSSSAKSKVCPRAPWRHVRTMLRLRAIGLYSVAEYRRFIRPRVHSLRDALVPRVVALVPGVLANTLFVAYYQLVPRHRGWWPLGMSKSPFHLRNWLANVVAKSVSR